MADYNWLDTNDDDDDEDYTPPRSSGRDDNALREARTAAKRNARELKQAREELAQAQAMIREFKVTEAIKEKGLPPKVAKLASNVPVEELDQWIEEYADVFGVQPPAGDQGEGGVPVAQETLDPNFAALQRITQQQGAAPAPPTGNADLLQRINSAQNEQELNMVLFGNVNGPQVY